MKENKIIKGTSYVLFSNILGMLLSVVVSFLLPKFLSVDSYSHIKTYQLYCVYVGFLHFGFVDGILLKYGGKANIEQSELNNNFLTLFIFQIMITFLLIGLSLILHNTILLFFALSVLPLNLISFFKILYQAIGNLKTYSRIVGLSAILNFIVNMVLVLLFKVSNFVIYLVCYNLLNYCILFVLWLKLKNKNFFTLYNYKNLKHNLIIGIKKGFFVMLGNIFFTFLITLDRVFVNLTFDNDIFALYSFAVSISSVVINLSDALSISLYNYICRYSKLENMRNISKYICIFSSIIISCDFLLKILINVFLPKYIDSFPIISFLFSAQLFFVVINCIFINLYKAFRLQKKYFYCTGFVFFLAIIINIVNYYLNADPIIFAFSTVILSIIYYLISMYNFRSYKFLLVDFIYLVIELFVFIILINVPNSLLGFTLYILFWLIISNLFYKNWIRNIFSKYTLHYHIYN